MTISITFFHFVNSSFTKYPSNVKKKTCFPIYLLQIFLTFSETQVNNKKKRVLIENEFTGYQNVEGCKIKIVNIVMTIFCKIYLEGQNLCQWS